MKHTQGKWQSQGINVILPDGSKYIPTHFDRLITESKANAKLIAKAPDLLKALELSTLWLEKIVEQGALNPEFTKVFNKGIESNKELIKKATE